ncbi:MAG: sensor histidine kinase [Myxococcales bacterium]|nr:sensor histidine kinase [Myxococcales bacterium]
MSSKPAAPTLASSDAILTPVGVLLALLVAGGVCLLPLLPPVRRVLGVSPAEVAVSMGGFALLLVFGAVVHPHRAKHPRLHLWWDRSETILVQVSVLFLVFASGRGDSFFWLLALVHVMIVGGNGHNDRFHYLVFAGLPALVGLAFVVLEHDGGAAALSVAVGGIAAYIYSLSVAVNRKLAEADAERARLAAELADNRVRAERERIARDIHDGIGADLAALDWRLRGLHQHVASDALQREVDELTGRLTHGTDELRTIVWALRTRTRTWRELVTYLRQRATELCGDRMELELVEQGDAGSQMHPGELALEFLRIVLELARNSVRHANAAHLRVVVRSDRAGLFAAVEDDGRGLADSALTREEGGLANIRHRLAKVGGQITVETGEPRGTRIAIGLPPAAESAPAAVAEKT